MQIKLVTLAFVALAAANPLAARAPLCPAEDTPSCCQLNIEGVVDTPCESVPGNPWNKEEFYTACAKTGTTAMCCLLNVAGDGVICDAP